MALGGGRKPRFRSPNEEPNSHKCHDGAHHARIEQALAQSAQVLAMYKSLQEIFEKMDLSVELLELSSRGGWRVRLDTGAAIELGGGSAEEVQAVQARLPR